MGGYPGPRAGTLGGGRKRRTAVARRGRSPQRGRSARGHTHVHEPGDVSPQDHGYRGGETAIGRPADEARKKLKEIDQELIKQMGGLSPGESAGADTQPHPEQQAGKWEEAVTAAFGKYRELAANYGAVPVAGREINTHIAKQRCRMEYAAVLNEPEANTLWELGRQHEAEEHLCCAYWVYHEAAKLVPAPSAERARARFEEMDKNPKIVAAAKVCRELQECHKLYNRAKRLVDTRPERAKELFGEIVKRAPEDSEVCRAARDELAAMK